MDNNDKIIAALHSESRVQGYTHNFYRYPARMLPDLARELVNNYTKPGDCIIDPFMGGGTSIIEAIVGGRKAIGIDINSLAIFITEVKTSPLSSNDKEAILDWARSLDFNRISFNDAIQIDDPRLFNLDIESRIVFKTLIDSTHVLRYPRQRKFARCCLLRLGQWSIDGKRLFPSIPQLREKFDFFINEMFDGLDNFVEVAKKNGIRKNCITSNRILIQRSSIGAQNDKQIKPFLGKPKLIITSPPYPNVHVLYHRWQVNGRKETPAPYWFIGMNDGQGESYYTMGGRSITGQSNYFNLVEEIYKSLRMVLHPDGLVAQLISFFNVSQQLPCFLEAMENAGFREEIPSDAIRDRYWRIIPNRKWYTHIGEERGAGRELLLFHRPRN